MDVLKYAAAFSLFFISNTLGLISSISLAHQKVSLDPEVNMNTTELITSKGYPCEDYDVRTSDGYILDIQRIPYGRKGSAFKDERPVVLLQHGLLSCSACWVENLSNESLGFLLADAGFDVWLGNSRGNSYGRRHKTLDPNQVEFWQFSWDEMAMYDLPATIEKVLNVSGAQQIYYVGHSQGSSIGYAQFSRDPVLASKIKLFVALAPALYMDLVKGPFKLLGPLSGALDLVYDLFGNGEFLPNDNATKWLGQDVCVTSIPEEICANMLFLICGFDEKETNMTRMPVYLGQHPAGTSVQNMNHYAQMVESPLAKMYDFGSKENMIRYNQSHPPVYVPSRMTVPVAMYSGSHDWLVSPGDAARLAQETSNLLFHKVIDGWQHLDFVWALNAPQQCYNDIIKLLKSQ